MTGVVVVVEFVEFVVVNVVVFCPRRNLNSVGDYSSSSVGVVCRLSSVVSSVVCRVVCLQS